MKNNNKYLFNGSLYGKGPLALKLISQYVSEHPNISYEALKEIFPDSLVPRFGAFQFEHVARSISAKERYFFKEEQLIRLTNEKDPIVVCNQFTAANIMPLIKIAENLSYEIVVIENPAGSES